MKDFHYLPNGKITIENLSLSSSYRLKIAIVKSVSGREISALSAIYQFSTDFDFSDKIIINELYPKPFSYQEEFIELLTHLIGKLI